MTRSKVLQVILIVLISISAGCRSDRYSIVFIPVPAKKAVDFNAYENIYYPGTEIKGVSGEVDTKSITDNFFINEFSKVVKKEISRKNIPSEKMRSEKQNDLEISAPIIVTIKKRSIVSSKKKNGKKIRVFKKVENWKMEMDLEFKETNSGKIVLKKKMTANLNAADPKRPDYNFRFLFRRLTERFIRRVMRLGKIESRYLLK